MARAPSRFRQGDVTRAAKPGPPTSRGNPHMTTVTEAKNGSSEMCLLCSYCKVAHLLDDCMKFRAAKEEAAYGFDPPFFRKALDRGIWSFFGITADRKLAP